MAGTGGTPLALTGPATPATCRRGRGSAATTINPRTVTQFEDVTSIPFVFARHPIYPEAHIHMNAIYSDAFMDMEELFNITAPPTRDTFVTDPVTIIKDEIRNNFIAPNAIDTPDPTTITPLWARCSFMISAGHRYSNRRLTLANLREAMQCTIACSVTHELKITIGIQALHFRPGLNYLQWGIDITDSATGFAAPAGSSHGSSCSGRCCPCSGSCCGTSIFNQCCDSGCNCSCACN